MKALEFNELPVSLKKRILRHEINIGHWPADYTIEMAAEYFKDWSIKFDTKGNRLYYNQYSKG